MPTVLIVAEPQPDGQLRKATLNALSAGAQISDDGDPKPRTPMPSPPDAPRFARNYVGQRFVTVGPSAVRSGRQRGSSGEGAGKSVGTRR